MPCAGLPCSISTELHIYNDGDGDDDGGDDDGGDDDARGHLAQ